MPPAEPPRINASAGAQQVLAAASALFSARGVDSVSIQDIATEAGVSKANVFHHFENKEQLYLAVIRSKVEEQHDDIADLIASPAPFAQRFLALIQRQLADMLRDESSTRLVMREIITGNVERAKFMATQIFTAKVKHRIAFFENALARGELRPGLEPYHCDMLVAACCMFHVNCRGVSQHITAELGTPALDTPDAFARAVCGMLIGGLAAPRQRSKAALKPAPQPAEIQKKTSSIAHRHSRSH